MSTYATEQMIKYVEAAKSTAQKASKDFDARSEKIQAMASRSIDLFGGTAVSRVAEIASETRLACDELYATLQMLVKLLDSQCRPILEQKPETRGIREVFHTIKWLNSESEISNMFTGSVNGSNLGELVGVNYFPSIENKMIQSFWETTYNQIPTRADDERKERQEQAAKAEEKKRQFTAAKAGYEELLAAWVEEFEKAKKKRFAEIEKRVNALKEKELKKVALKYDAKIAELQSDIEKAEQDKQEAESKLQNLGFFAFGGKKEQKGIIESAERRVYISSYNLKKEKAAYELEKSEALKNIAPIVDEIAVNVLREIPAPRKPETPQSILRELDSACCAILEGMSRDELYTIHRMQMEIPECCDLTPQRVSAYVRKLMDTKDIDRVELNGKVYFYLN